MNAGDVVFDAALVGAARDLEESAISPLLVPRVFDEPVGLAVLGTPANHFDSMTSEHGSRRVLVDSALVGREVRVDGKCNSEGSVRHDLSLHLLDAGEAERLGTLGLVGRVRFGVLVFGARLFALDAVLLRGARGGTCWWEERGARRA